MYLPFLLTVFCIDDLLVGELNPVVALYLLCVNDFDI